MGRVVLRLWDRIRQYPHLIQPSIDYPYTFTATQTREQRLEHLDEAAPVDSLQNWQASWYDEESPLLSKNDPIIWSVYASDMSVVVMHADTPGVTVRSALKKF
jgi:hypothetical protein